MFIRRNHINITIKDIAKLANVSHSTVSRSLNDMPSVKKETKEKIRKIAEELNFEFNSGARSLSTRKTGTVGIIHPELYGDFSGSLFCGSLIAEIQRKLDKAGMDFIPINSENRENSSSNLKRLIRQQKVDAFIIVDSMVSIDDWNFIKKNNIPAIQLHYRPKFCSIETMNYVFSDNFTGGKLATDYLIEHGCKNIMCIAIKSEHPEIIDRTEGFLHSMRAYNLKIDKNLIFEGECSLFYGEKIIRENKEYLSNIDGVFVHADIIALGVVKELTAQGYAIPEDIRIVGYDDIELGTYWNPRLTTIHQPKEILAEKACIMLQVMLEGNGNKGELFQDIIKPSLVVRDSC